MAAKDLVNLGPVSFLLNYFPILLGGFFVLTHETLYRDLLNETSSPRSEVAKRKPNTESLCELVHMAWNYLYQEGTKLKCSK